MPGPETRLRSDTRMPRTLQLVVSYDGTEFHGFQRLSRARSVQAVLEAAWREVTGEAARMVGAGRTDAGVHALGQVVSLRTGSGLPTRRVALALNGVLPPDVRVRRAGERDDAFHARFSAVQRTYRYLIRRRGRPSVFLDRFSLLETGSLDTEAMRETARLLVGCRNFQSFGSPGPGRHGVRHLRRAVVRECDGWLIISFTANAFLRSMARLLTERLLAVGRGEETPEDVEQRLMAADRRQGGKAASPRGLYLARVDY